MEHFKTIEKRDGCDVGMINCDLHPEDKRGCVGKSGLDKNLLLHELVEIAFTMTNPRPNIIIKAGKNAKWYLKHYELSELEEAIEKTKQYRDTIRATMYIITWS